MSLWRSFFGGGSGGGAPSGAAGGDLAGNYPNPTVSLIRLPIVQAFQAGITGNGGSGPYAVSFPSAFPNQCTAVALQVNDTGTVKQGLNEGIANRTRFGFNVNVGGTIPNGSTMFWDVIAMGG